MPMIWRVIDILVRLRRPHEPWIRPPDRPSPGEVGAAVGHGHGSGRRKRKRFHLGARKGLRTAQRARNSGASSSGIWASYVLLLQYGHSTKTQSGRKKVNTSQLVTIPLVVIDRKRADSMALEATVQRCVAHQHHTTRTTEQLLRKANDLDPSMGEKQGRSVGAGDPAAAE